MPLTAEDVHDFYLGFSNEVVWPLFHDLQSLCNFEPAYWRAYCDVNRRFAEVVAANAEPGDFIWVHDYHLMNVAGELRRAKRTHRFVGLIVKAKRSSTGWPANVAVSWYLPGGSAPMS